MLQNSSGNLKILSTRRVKKFRYRGPTKIRRNRKNLFFFFYVLLTVHLSIFILVINQLDAQNFFFAISLFHASTCFEHHVLIIRRSKLYYTASSIIIPTGGRPVHTPVHGTATYRCDDTRGCIMQF